MTLNPGPPRCSGLPARAKHNPRPDLTCRESLDACIVPGHYPKPPPCGSAAPFWRSLRDTIRWPSFLEHAKSAQRPSRTCLPLGAEHTEVHTKPREDWLLASSVRVCICVFGTRFLYLAAVVFRGSSVGRFQVTRSWQTRYIQYVVWWQGKLATGSAHRRPR